MAGFERLGPEVMPKHLGNFHREAGAAQEVRNPTTLAGRLRDLDTALDGIHQALDKLEAMATPVMCPSDEANCKLPPLAQIAARMSPVAEELAGATGTAWRAVARINQIAERLEL
jgi:hypothetical protein